MGRKIPNPPPPSNVKPMPPPAPPLVRRAGMKDLQVYYLDAIEIHKILKEIKREVKALKNR